MDSLRLVIILAIVAAVGFVYLRATTNNNSSSSGSDAVAFMIPAQSQSSMGASLPAIKTPPYSKMSVGPSKPFVELPQYGSVPQFPHSSKSVVADPFPHSSESVVAGDMSIVNVNIPALYPCVPHEIAREKSYWTFPRRKFDKYAFLSAT